MSGLAALIGPTILRCERLYRSAEGEIAEAASPNGPGHGLDRRSFTKEILMIKHIVMWTVQAETTDERKARAILIKKKFESLAGHIPGLLHLEVGIDESRASYACDVVLYSEFETRAALEDYAHHPAHLRVRRELEGLRSGRYQVDYSVAMAREDHHLARQPGALIGE